VKNLAPTRILSPDHPAFSESLVSEWLIEFSFSFRFDLDPKYDYFICGIVVFLYYYSLLLIYKILPLNLKSFGSIRRACMSKFDVPAVNV
jgi:hypothetical protein